MQKTHAPWILCPLLVAAAGCVAAEKSSNYLSPTVAGPIPGVAITAPHPVTPDQGSRISVEAQPLTLSVENATTSGVRPLSYSFEVATDLEFTNKIFERQNVPPGDGRTSLRLPDPLATGRSYYWRARAEDGANTSEYSFPVVFTIFTPIVIGRPTPLAPIGSTSDPTPRFVIRNAPRSGPVGPIVYTIELANNDTFTDKIAVWLAREQSNQTTLNPPGLPGGRQIFWRVQASDPTTSGPWSETKVFRLPEAPTPAPPPTSPGRACGPPYPTSAEGIVNCRRSQYGTPMSSGQILTMLRGVAKDMNAAGVSGGPYGILEKESGHNCGGYSCDIICAGQGTSQRQHDVLADAEGAAKPMWGSPKRWPNIRVDTCHIQ